MVAESNIPARFAVGELFCGVGGLSRGFHAIGFQPVFANDAWDLALHNFLMNFDRAYAVDLAQRAGDILSLPGSVEEIRVNQILGEVRHPSHGKSMEFGDLDVLLGGPPCQGFSLNSHIRSADDPRNHLFRHYVRLLRGLSPKVFVLENVPGMLSLDGGAFIEELIRRISSSRANGCPGYELDFRILNAAHYGVPQERFRIVIVGTRRDVADKAGRVTLPVPQHFSLAQAHFKGGRTHTFHYAIGHGKRQLADELPHIGVRLRPPIGVSDAIGDLPALKNGGGADRSSYGAARKEGLSGFQEQMRGDCRVLANHWCRELLPPNDERVKHVPVGGDWRSIPKELLPPGMQRALRKDHTKRYGRFAPTDLAGTLLTKPDPHWGTFLHYDVKQQRLISVREAARLQSFPDSHVFYGSQVDQYRLCGNAVPPLMAQAVAAEVQKILELYQVSRGRRRAKQLAVGLAAGGR